MNHNSSKMHQANFEDFPSMFILYISCVQATKLEKPTISITLNCLFLQDHTVLRIPAMPPASGKIFVSVQKFIHCNVHCIYQYKCKSLLFWVMGLGLEIVKTQRNSTQSNSKATSVGVRNSSHVFHPTTNYSATSRPARELKLGTDNRHSLDQSD